MSLTEFSYNGNTIYHSVYFFSVERKRQDKASKKNIRLNFYFIFVYQHIIQLVITQIVSEYKKGFRRKSVEFCKPVSQFVQY